MVLSGFCYQVHNLGASYFSYNTVTKLDAELANEIRAPSLTVCPIYLDVLDVERYNRDHGRQLLVKSSSPKDIFGEEHQLTVKEIFDYTPDISSAISYCVIRRPSTYGFRPLEAAECHRQFAVIKFYLQQFICYKFTYVGSNDTYNYRQPAYALTYPSLIFLIELNQEQFDHFQWFKVIVNRAETLPEMSAAVAPLVTRFYDKDTNESMFNMFSMTYFSIDYLRLPKPYSTNCRDYSAEGYRNQRHCFSACVANRTLELFDKLPFTAIMAEPLNKRHISELDLKSANFSEALTRIDLKCSDNCYMKDCNSGYTLSQVETAKFKGSTWFVLNVPRQPSLMITHSPKVSFDEFLVFVLSCTGSWFGVSALSVRPSRLYNIVQHLKITRHFRIFGPRNSVLFAPSLLQQLRNERAVDKAHIDLLRTQMDELQEKLGFGRTRPSRSSN
ncbi:hypothetical protein HDE_14227 [Halotydeus destructor]|nr:hypothetical protein HDE_14227 [Halotydeus destructor]